MSDKAGVMAAIMTAIDQIMQEETQALAMPPRPRYEPNFWKYAGLEEMMRMRVLWQLRIGRVQAR
ncbi:MAG: hypothetical protein KAS54_01870 [Dehalococcoidia bacterium]|nr:hypothetical protein [Dehalococcoidia bacterium]